MTDDRNDRFFEDPNDALIDEQDTVIERHHEATLNDGDVFVEGSGEALLNECNHGTLELRAEQLEVHKRDVEQGRVRIDKRIENVPFYEDIDVEMDVVEVQRVPRFEEFDSPPESRQEGDTLIIPVIEEVLVVTRRYRVTEEVHVTTRRELRTERVEDELRREVLTVDVIDNEPGIDTDRQT